MPNPGLPLRIFEKALIRLTIKSQIETKLGESFTIYHSALQHFCHRGTLIYFRFCHGTLINKS